MSTLIVLTSSPPQVFARSPTPADSSSPALPSATAILNGGSPGRNRFKTRSTLRDGCKSGFSTARQVLAEKGGAENIPLATPLRNRFRTSPARSGKLDTVNNFKTKQPTLPRAISKESRTAQPKLVETTVEPTIATAPQPAEAPIVIQIGRKDVRRTNKRAQSPLLLQKAASRRTDWTPPKPTTTAPIGSNLEDLARTFPTGLLGSFGFADAENESKEYQVGTENPTKRRKLEFPEASTNKTTEASAVPSLPNAAITKPPTKRGKSPTKKPLTITALATSKFAGQDEPEPTSMLQYLTGSQALLESNADAGGLDEKVNKTKAALKRLKATKKGSKKSLLVSPTSAMRSFEEQEAIFGSASQLARDESPTLLKDTIEAMNQSESSFCPEPTSPLQLTQATSIELAPHTGTSRFRRSRNLWSAAGRDDDNALLHIDMVDLTDTPAVRNAFAGKDVMVQPGFSRSVSPVKQGPSLRDGYSPLAKSRSDSIMDIDDIMTPSVMSNVQQTSAFHTSGRSVSPKKPQQLDSEPVNKAELQKDTDTAVLPKPTLSKKRHPRKPHYAGFTDHELKKQISAYGFKAVKKREKMVELLERCWEEKHGSGTETPVEPQLEAEPEGPGYGDFLSNVHDVSARPVPKVTKPKAPRKNKETDGTDTPAKKPRAPRKKKEVPLDEDGNPVKKPRPPRKKKEVDEEALVEAETKKPVKKPAAKRKAKGNTLSAETVSAKDDADNELDEVLQQQVQQAQLPADILEMIAIESAPATTPPTTKSAAKKSSTPKPKAAVSQPESSITTILTPPSSVPTILDQITEAIKQQSAISRSEPKKPPRNHQTNPTWHEKILLYDPIILEELALWLNTEGLGAIGEDREISALEVRSWCEGRGICCLWKGGWRGNKGKED